MYFTAFVSSWELFENVDFTSVRPQAATLIRSKQPSLVAV